MVAGEIIQMSPDEAEYYKSRSRKMKVTAYVRFDLSERLSNIEYINLIISVLMTVYLTGWVIFVQFYPSALSDEQKTLLSFTSVMASITLLCMTILDHASARSVRANTFLESADSALRLADELDLACLTGDRTLATSLIASYSTSLRAAKVNHSSEDYQLYVDKENSRNQKFFSKARIRYQCRIIMYYAKRVLLQIASSLGVLFATALVVVGAVGG
ncbi:SLATT domain-containing protein [Paracoccus gahaiensis]